MRRYVVVIVGLSIAALAVPLLLALFVLDPVIRLPRMVALVGVLLLGANSLWLRFASTRAIAAFTTGVLHVLIAIAVTANAGASGPGFVLLLCLPAITSVLHGQRAAWIDTGLLLAFMALLQSLEATVGLPRTAPVAVWPAIQLISAALAIGLTLLAIAAFRRAQDRHRAELSAARDAAEAASRAKSRFLSTMSHELRTPMVGVLGAADLLAGQGHLDPRGRQLLQILRRAAHAQLRLIGNVLDLSRIEADALDIERLPIAVTELIDDVVIIFRPTAISKRLDLSVEVDPALPSRILGDPLRLHQILANLVNNALKFTERGAIRVRAVAVAADPPRIRISVEDSGIGIPADRVGHIFDDFSQAEESTSRHYGGSGLGLAISRRLAAAMGGTLTVTSTPGAGSVFALEVPAPPADASLSGARAVTVAPDLAPEATKQLTVLVTDDDAVNRLILGAMVRELGHSDIEAVDGADALVKLGLHAIDLVLLDMHMPGLDGPATARSIRAQSGRSATVPILGLTADVTPTRLEEFRGSGVDDVLAKPLDVATLRHALQRVAADGDPALPRGA